jgi:EAL domain-containing protein (putative c-di-GMP-specific phosphodiesterase class I)/GGDEF domain-containing protein
MSPTEPRPEDALERYRNGYLKLRSVLHDRTTGLPAYPLLFDSLRAALEKRRHVGVLHVEIPNVEFVESLYGWQVLDRVLATVATLLKESVGAELPANAMLALNGVAGERFVAFLPDAPGGGPVDGAYLQGVGIAIREKLEAAFDGDDLASLSPRLTVRAGHALLSLDPFYRFERRVHASVEEARSLTERRELRRERGWGAELRRIIRDSAVSTVFQPVVDLESRAVLGWEALARGPKDSMFEMPRTMFALSSRLGSSIDLDRLCRRSALHASGSLPGKGKLFLNVLTGSIADPDWLMGGVARALETMSLTPRDLVLEVSERGTDGELHRLSAALDALRGQGFGLAVDDVGTGYGSLATLEELKPDFLKVDLSLVHGIHENLIKQELLTSLVHIGGRLGAAVIAEGVESEEEVAALRVAGARYGQGFLFAQPAPYGTASRASGPGLLAGD